MTTSENLRKAKAAKNDEWYTQLSDIIKEIAQHDDYVKQFEGKVVYCNCDDPEWSAFWEFFRKFFHKLKLKKMISTHYNADGSPSYMLEWSGEKINGNTVNMIKKPLKGNGDFRSPECIELLKEADIVATNPPFSLYREYINILYKYNKKFVILGNPNAIAYKEVFPLLRDGKMQIGYKSMGSDMYFTVPDKVAEELVRTKKEGSGYVRINGKVYGRCQAMWYTNLNLDKSHEPLILTKNYKGNEEKYPKYDNYDAIECNKVANIPKDYFPCWYDCPHAGECEYAQTEGRGKALCESPCNGEIGVPITVLADFCPDQMEALSLGTGKMAGEYGVQKNYRGRTDLSLARDISEKNGKISKKKLSLQPNHYQVQAQEIDVHAEDISACRSRTCHHTAANSSESSVQMQSLQNASRCQTVNMDQEDSMLKKDDSIQDSSFRGKKCNGVIGVPLTYISAHCQDMFDILWKSGDIEWCLSDSCSIFTPPDNEKKILYKKQNRTWRVQNPYIVDEKGNAHTTYNRIFIRRRKDESERNEGAGGGRRKCNGMIGVPITFMSEWCMEQFEVIGLGNGYLGQSVGIGGIPKEVKAMMKGHSAAGDLYMMINGKPKVPYNRIIIRRRKEK